MKRIIQAGTFKTHCLKIMDEVQKNKIPVIITKRNIPIAKLVPIIKSKEKIFGKLKGTIVIKKDILEPIDEIWDANL